MNSLFCNKVPRQVIANSNHAPKIMKHIFKQSLKCQYQIVYETTHLAKLYQKLSLYLRTLHKLFVCFSRLSAIDSLTNQASCILEHLGCAAP